MLSHVARASAGFCCPTGRGRTTQASPAEGRSPSPLGPWRRGCRLNRRGTNGPGMGPEDPISPLRLDRRDKNGAGSGPKDHPEETVRLPRLNRRATNRAGRGPQDPGGWTACSQASRPWCCSGPDGRRPHGLLQSRALPPGSPLQPEVPSAMPACQRTYCPAALTDAAAPWHARRARNSASSGRSRCVASWSGRADCTTATRGAECEVDSRTRAAASPHAWAIPACPQQGPSEEESREVAAQALSRPDSRRARRYELHPGAPYASTRPESRAQAGRPPDALQEPPDETRLTPRPLRAGQSLIRPTGQTTGWLPRASPVSPADVANHRVVARCTSTATGACS